MTDHYARAVKTLQAVLDYAETDENTDALVSIIAAQVHAILHLAEQQRIANLIALNEQWEDSEHPDWYAQPSRIRPEIARTLRIQEEA